ncbi:predicted protein [Aspergillus nidulans FGSC A4]|uniref:Uncharacterized protein n=1 Tax=Emericella nidulans (strain FGSC A4 / ATCC 38163 / CBS 112.46 / NRRL 194 / M139) TaxID=227321 RepID=Q5AZX8_EMENI|nr:hypothetical protein [Aspergillus nidulans FGSC A4]EAA57938.1 predicted protein [Aspergillus nidulans FGSC A4]CBF70080.1 TPA: hypothetical protein ANIA_06152 [Aspergillus nidulans FGSC A4]|eukprot:XP_663756.1 predicted protein [Aspergillus nidulans FGSC A4]
MPDLADLPAELLDEILFLAFGTTPRYNNRYDEGVLDIKGLSRLLLVNRKHHQAFLPRVYSHWTYIGTLHSYSGLWKFLRTIIENPSLALIVEVLNIGNWGVCPSYLDRNHELQDQDEQVQFALNDKETVKTAIRRAGLQGDIESQIYNAIFADGCEYQSRYRRPLVALLLTCLPSISKQWPATGRLWCTVDLTTQPGGIHVLSEVPGYHDRDPNPLDGYIDDPSLKLDNIWPVFYLDRLHIVRLYDFDPEGFSRLVQQKIQTALKSLSFPWDNDKAKAKENVWQTFNNEFWAAILKYKRTLEYLDVFHDFPPERRKYRLADYFGPLTEFTQLRYLSSWLRCSLAAILRSVAPLRLKEALLASIESLVFAAEDAGRTITDLPRQVEEVVSDFPHLKTLELQMVGCICTLTINLQYCPLPQGARCLGRWKEAYSMRIDAGFRQETMYQRAARKAAGRQETSSPEPPQRQYRPLKTHVLPFQDHGKSPSFMVSESEEHSLLPPLIAAEGFDDNHWRLDVYFLSNATNEGRFAHYQAEKAVRLPPPTTPRLPGMIEIYDDDYHPDRSWRDGALHMCHICYGPGFELGQPLDESWYGIDPDPDQSLSYLIWEHSRWDGWQGTLGVYQRATDREWITWSPGACKSWVFTRDYYATSIQKDPVDPRARLVKQFLNLDQLNLDWYLTYGTTDPDAQPACVPTREEISTILRPWQSDNMHRRAWRVWQVYINAGGNNPLLLRTWYDPADDERVNSWATLSEEFPDDADRAILDDRALFDFGAGPWQRVLEILPGIAIPLVKDTPPGYVRQKDWRADIDDYTFYSRFTEGLNAVERSNPSWRNDLNILVKKNAAARCFLHLTFETDNFLLAYLDAKGRVTMQGQILVDEDRLTRVSLDWFERRPPIEVFEGHAWCGLGNGFYAPDSIEQGVL